MSKSYARRRTDPDDLSHPDNKPYTGKLVNHPLRNQDAVVTSGTLRAFEALLELLDSGDGWIRMTSDLDSKTIYLKYKYKHGKWKNHYVMAVATPDILAWGITLLLAKVEQVAAGERKPTHDSAYNYED
jgi:hypothetical protein